MEGTLQTNNEIIIKDTHQTEGSTKYLFMQLILHWKVQYYTKIGM